MASATCKRVQRLRPCDRNDLGPRERRAVKCFAQILRLADPEMQRHLISSLELYVRLIALQRNQAGKNWR